MCKYGNILLFCGLSPMRICLGVGQGDPLGRSWERGRRERMEEQARRQREEAERVRRELEEMEEEERRQAAIPST